MAKATVIKGKGFRFKRDATETLTLDFDAGHALHGLEITVLRRVPVGYVLAAARSDVAEAARLFAQSVVRWNVEDDAGAPVEPSIEAFGEHVSVDDLAAIMRAWSGAMTEPSVPLGGR